MVRLVSRLSEGTGLDDESESVFETCVSCRKPTNVRKDTHVDMRKYYVEGAGQLHKECYEQVYGLSPIRILMDSS